MIHKSKHYMTEPEGAAVQSKSSPRRGTLTLKAEKMPARWGGLGNCVGQGGRKRYNRVNGPEPGWLAFPVGCPSAGPFRVAVLLRSGPVLSSMLCVCYIHLFSCLKRSTQRAR